MFVGIGEGLAKGPVVKALDKLSRDGGSRAGPADSLKTLRDNLIGNMDPPDLKGAEPAVVDFPGLTGVIKEHLLGASGLFPDKLDQIAEYLDKYWFADKPREYARFHMRSLYGSGLLKVIDSSLRGGARPTPIDAYWYLHADRVEMITLEGPNQITFIVATPPPTSPRYANMPADAACEAWITTTTEVDTAFEVWPPRLDYGTKLVEGDKSTGWTERLGYRVATYKIAGKTEKP
jgi:hypothetical protein